MKAYSMGMAAVVLLGLTVISGCATTDMEIKSAIADAQDPQLISAYEDKFRSVVKEIQADPDYKRIPLDAKEDRDWFITQAFLFWDDKMPKERFVNEGVSRFPGHEASFEYLANQFRD